MTMQLTTDAPSRMITIQEAADRMALCVRTVRRMIERGEFPRPVKLGRSTRIHEREFDAFIEAKLARRDTRNA